MIWRVVLLLLALQCAAARARGPEWPQYSLSEWKHEDGLPSTKIYALAQTADGFLWLGTADGLVRFDGLQFVQEPITTDGVRPLGNVLALASSRANDLLAGTANGTVLRLRNGQTTHVTVGGSVSTLDAGDERQIAVTTSQGIWTIAASTLAILNHAASADRPQAPMCEARARLQSLPALSGISVCFRDRLGNDWVGTHTRGIYLVRPDGSTAQFGRTDGLTSEDVTAIFEDREENIWVATSDGLNRLRRDKFRTIKYGGADHEKRPDDLAGSAETIWTSSRAGIGRIAESGRSAIDLDHHPTALTSDAGGNAVAVIGDELVTIDTSGVVRLRKHLPVADVSLLAAAGRNVLWLYSPTQGLLQSRDGQTPQQFRPFFEAPCHVTRMSAAGRDLWLACDNASILRVTATDAIRYTLPRSVVAPVNQILAVADGNAWFATDSGLVHYDGNRFQHWDRASGLPGSRVQWIREDNDGGLWLGYSLGIVRIGREVLLKHDSEQHGTLTFHVYDDGDGILGTPEVRGASAVAQASDGSLWFTTSEGVAHIDVHHVLGVSQPPPVHIVAISSNGTDVALQKEITLSHETRLIEVAFTAPSLTDARKVQFRYRLEGFDDRWQETHTVRRVSYANLKPGVYRFHVIACNNDGVWNNAGDVLKITIRPAWYQTAIFRIVIVFFALVLLFVLYRVRIARRDKALIAEMEVRIRERTEIARELHDHLLQEMLAVSLQLELANAAVLTSKHPVPFIQRALELTQSAMKRGRGALTTLRNDTLRWSTIAAKLERAAEDTARGGAARFHVQVEGHQVPLSIVAGEQIMLILQEAVRNAIAYTTGLVHVHVEFRARALQIRVSDLGQGLTAEQVRGELQDHYGIRGMNERAARLNAELLLHQVSGNGAEWRLIVPASVAYATQAFAAPGFRARFLNKWVN